MTTAKRHSDNMPIPYVKPSITELEISYSNDAVRTGWGERCYDYINRFEAEFAAWVGTKYAIATSSCTGALQMGMHALGLGPGDEVILVLQLCICAFFVMCSGGPSLVSSAPKRPVEDEGYAGWRFQDEFCQEVSDFWYGRDQIGYAFQAAIIGLVLFGLLQASRRRSAANLARNAAAAMTRLIWRCQPCQDRASQ